MNKCINIEMRPMARLNFIRSNLTFNAWCRYNLGGQMWIVKFVKSLPTRLLKEQENPNPGISC